MPGTWSIELFRTTLGDTDFHGTDRCHRICTRDRHGDLAVARAAARTKVPMCISALTMDPMEDIAAEFGRHPGDFSSSIRRRTASLAESFCPPCRSGRLCGDCGDLDTWVPGWRPRDLTTANFPQLRGNCLSNYISDPVFKSKATTDIGGADPRAAVPQWSATFGSR